ncbi:MULTISPECIES: helix-turn-helix domain-containing protein [Micromonospora]|uniref:helix-turn-helix domain-containing protein n=1 Tax=Micromonospora TaxID=1873 RepID=UPI0011507592|nr:MULTISPECIES: helix-turn-helix domain-containing protein [unclassified Micromonospora]MBQ1039845.1 helix-turn-helix domain-containing protein [Micromonospora sp. C81]TQJ20595.1 excisionase family DNA binding protein [Micromonospora sp. A202]WTI19359.1 helix-turn-helix domain-containing protein [Micromonospora zamorensis]
MTEDMYSVEQVADRLGLHVRTVRSYIRSGRLRAVRIGKQYRIAASDLDALTGQAPVAPGVARQAEVSSIVQIDGVDRAAADRLGTLVLTSANTGHDQASPLRVQTVYDEQRHRMKIIVLGDPASTAELLHLLDAVLNADNGLLDREVNDA